MAFIVCTQWDDSSPGDFYLEFSRLEQLDPAAGLLLRGIGRDAAGLTSVIELWAEMLDFRRYLDRTLARPELRERVQAQDNWGPCFALRTPATATYMHPARSGKGGAVHRACAEQQLRASLMVLPRVTAQACALASSKLLESGVFDDPGLLCHAHGPDTSRGWTVLSVFERSAAQLADALPRALEREPTRHVGLELEYIFCSDAFPVGSHDPSLKSA